MKTAPPSRAQDARKGRAREFIGSVAGEKVKLGSERVRHQPPVKLITAVLSFALLTQSLVAQNASITSKIGQTTVTNAEPAVTDLNGLFRTAQVVAVVRIVSGDTERYSTAMYKGEVVEGFKGAARGETVYFGPYVGFRLGWEYVLFLRAVPEIPKPVSPTPAAGSNLRYYAIFNEGYSSMETNYQCIFRGKEIKEQCDYAVRICTDYIKAPKSFEFSPPLDKETPFGCRWTRRAPLLAFLQKLSAAER